AVARVPREAHRSGRLSRLREHAQPGVEGARAAEVEEGSDRSDDAESESDSPADPDQGIESRLRIRQGEVRQALTRKMSNLRVGTSGWNYPSGKGTWNGVFYPKPRPKGFDELAFYAEHFDTVEVNSTFYGQPRAEITRGWADRTPSGFEFSVKLYQSFTHPRMFEERLRRSVLDTRSRHGASASARDSLEPSRGAKAPSMKNDERVQRKPRRRGAAPQELERQHRRNAPTAERVRCRMGPDRRTEVPVLDSPELPSERGRVLLHAAARPECEELVEARQIRGPVRLSVFLGRAERVFRDGRCGAAAREEAVPL